MFTFLKNWFGRSKSEDTAEAMDMFRKTGSHRALKPTVRPPQTRTAAPTANKPSAEQPAAEEQTGGSSIENNGPGKNVLVRKRYVREDTGTHETLKILDDSVIEAEEESGLDPYNTGRFDRSKHWDKRYLK